MRVLIQRVDGASVTVEGEVVGAIGHGLTLFTGIAGSDTERELAALADKIANLRIFEDIDGKMNRSAADLLDAGEEVGLLVVSQFTLYGDVRKGRRPSFMVAASPDHARPMIERFTAMLKEKNFPVAQGKFGAHMLVTLSNDGPFTIWIDSEDLRGSR